MRFRNPYPHIADLHCYDFSNGVKIDQKTIDEWVERTYEECKNNIDSNGFAYSKTSSGDSFVQCRITNYTDITIEIVNSSGYKRLNYTKY